MKLVVRLENFEVAVMKRCTQVERSGGDMLGHIFHTQCCLNKYLLVDLYQLNDLLSTKIPI